MKMFKKTLSILLAVFMLAGCVSVVSLAADGDITVSLRIEGIDSCFYSNTVKVPASSSALDVIKAADAGSDSLAVTVVDGAYGPYITEINGLVAGTKTEMHYDGWNYVVNYQSPSFGVADYVVKENDEVIVYYGDPFGAGMQLPIVNLDELQKGFVSFTSMDTTYDENWQPVVKENPVKDYVLFWGTENGVVELHPDATGRCRIPQEYMEWGPHSLQIQRFDNATGLPTVLRLAPDYTVTPFDITTLGEYIVHIFVAILEQIENIFNNIVI